MLGIDKCGFYALWCGYRRTTNLRASRSGAAAKHTPRKRQQEQHGKLNRKRGGDQLGGLFKNYAEAAAAKVLPDGMRNSDFASVLWYPADGDRLLREIRIRALLHDCQIAVLGISLMT